MSKLPAHTTIHRVFCANAKARRMFMRLTQSQVADMLGLTQPSYAAIETGKSVPSIETVAKVATILRTTAAQLLTPNSFAEPEKKSRSSVASR